MRSRAVCPREHGGEPECCAGGWFFGVTCLSCQAVEAAVAAGNVLSLEQELKRQARVIAERRAEVNTKRRRDDEDTVPRVEYERVVNELKAVVAELNGRRKR